MLLTNWMDGWMNGFGERETLTTRTATEKKIKKSISFLTYIHTYYIHTIVLSLVFVFCFVLNFSNCYCCLSQAYTYTHIHTFIHTRIRAQTNVSSSFCPIIVDICTYIHAYTPVSLHTPHPSFALVAGRMYVCVSAVLESSSSTN